jgi:ABC-type transporter Mla subunit MlaD
MSDPESRRRASPALALLVLLIVALLAYIGWQQDLFTRREPLYVEVPDAAGMSEGMPVTVHGVVIGKVRAIAPSTPPSGDAAMRVELGIERAALAQILKGTEARLVQDESIGKPAIALVPPRGLLKPANGAVAAGDLLPFERDKDRSQVVQEMQAALLPVIADAQKLTESLRDPDGPLQQTLKASQDVAARLPALTDKAGEVIDQTRESLKTLESGAATTLQKASRTLGAVEQAAPAVIAKVQEAAATSQKASAEVQSMAVQANERLPAVLDQVQAAATQTNQMVSSARQTWPISMLTGTPTTPQSLPIDSIGGLPLPEETK